MLRLPNQGRPALKWLAVGVVVIMLAKKGLFKQCACRPRLHLKNETRLAVGGAQRGPRPSTWPRVDNEITVNSGACGGLGNMMFRVAFLHAMGRKLNRSAFFFNGCARSYQAELHTFFPDTSGLVFKERPKNAIGVDFGLSEWRADNETRLAGHEKDRIMLITGAYLQSFKYFHAEKAATRRIFRLEPSYARLVSQYFRRALPNEKAHKLCVHMRRGFRKHFMIMSEQNFTLEAVRTVSEHLRKTSRVSDIDVVLFSDDKEFADQVGAVVKVTLNLNTLVVFTLSRAGEMGLAHGHCDSMILTSVGSTFGWWLAYLMREDTQPRVFYNGVVFKKKFVAKVSRFLEDDYIPPKWTRILAREGKVVLSNRSEPAILAK